MIADWDDDDSDLPEPEENTCAHGVHLDEYCSECELDAS